MNATHFSPRNAPTTPPPPPGAIAAELDERALELEEMAQRILARAADLRAAASFSRGGK